METEITVNLNVRGGASAVDFYKQAFGATEVMRLSSPDGHVVAELAVYGAGFFVADESPEHGNLSAPWQRARDRCPRWPTGRSAIGRVGWWILSGTTGSSEGR